MWFPFEALIILCLSSTSSSYLSRFTWGYKYISLILHLSFHWCPVVTQMWFCASINNVTASKYKRRLKEKKYFPWGQILKSMWLTAIPNSPTCPPCVTSRCWVWWLAEERAGSCPALPLFLAQRLLVTSRALSSGLLAAVARFASAVMSQMFQLA